MSHWICSDPEAGISSIINDRSIFEHREILKGSKLRKIKERGEKKGRKCKGIDEGVNADTGETNQRRILFYIVS